MQVGLIADSEVRNSDKYPAANRLVNLPGAGGLALCWERRGAGRDMLVGLLFVLRTKASNAQACVLGSGRVMQ